MQKAEICPVEVWELVRWDDKDPYIVYSMCINPWVMHLSCVALSPSTIVLASHSIIAIMCAERLMVAWHRHSTRSDTQPVKHVGLHVRLYNLMKFIQRLSTTRNFPDTWQITLLIWVLTVFPGNRVAKGLPCNDRLAHRWSAGSSAKSDLLPSSSAQGSPGGLAHLAGAQPHACQSGQAVSEQGPRFPAWYRMHNSAL